MEGRLNMKNSFKTKIFSMMLVFSIILGQMVGIGSFRVKAADTFSVQIVVESNTGIIVSDTSNKANGYEAIKDVLDRHSIGYDLPMTDYGRMIKMINGISTADDWSTYWYSYGKRNGNYLSLDTPDKVTMQNNDKLIIAFQNASTKLANKITYSTNKANEPLTITLESSSLYDATAPAASVSGISAKVYKTTDKNNSIFNSVINYNKIVLPNGLQEGQYTLVLSDFRTNTNEMPKVIADTFAFDITAATQTGTPSDNSNNTPSSPYDRDNTKVVKDIQTDLTNTSNYIKNKSAGDAWSIISMAKLGLKPDLTFINQSAADIKKNNGIADYTNTDLEKLIMVLTAAGYTPYNFMGYNLASELYNRDIDSFLINDAIYGLMAYNYANITGNYSINKNKLVDLILKDKLAYKKDNTDITGWALSGDAINPDITGLAINALSPYYKDNTSVKTAVDTSVDSLSKLQTESGYLADSYGYSSESLDVVILGLTSIGVNPEGDKFKKSKGDLVSAMLSFKGTDGQFKHSIDGKNDFIATEEALRALISLKEFKTKGIYNYYNSSIDSAKLPVFAMSGEEPSKATAVESENQKVLPQTGSSVDSNVIYTLGTIITLTGLFFVLRTKPSIK